MRLAIRNTEANNHLCNDKLIPKLMGHVSPGCRVIEIFTFHMQYACFFATYILLIFLSLGNIKHHAGISCSRQHDVR